MIDRWLLFSCIVNFVLVVAITISILLRKGFVVVAVFSVSVMIHITLMIVVENSFVLCPIFTATTKSSHPSSQSVIASILKTFVRVIRNIRSSIFVSTETVPLAIICGIVSYPFGINFISSSGSSSSVVTGVTTSCSPKITSTSNYFIVADRIRTGTRF